MIDRMRVWQNLLYISCMVILGVFMGIDTVNLERVEQHASYRIENETDTIKLEMVKKHAVHRMENQIDPVSKLVGFYHTTLINSWQEVLLAQLSHVESSGLMNASAALHMTVLGNQTEFEASEVQAVAHGLPKVHVRFLPEITLWEYPTLSSMHAHCMQNPNDFVYYFHSKGVTKAPGSVDFTRERAWSLVMEHFLMDRFDDCVSRMRNNYDKWACGVKFTDGFPYHFSGNFFWAACHYLRRHNPPLVKSAEMDREVPWVYQVPEDRGYCEAWLLDSTRLRTLPMRDHVINCFADGTNHYVSDFDLGRLDGLACQADFKKN